MGAHTHSNTHTLMHSCTHDKHTAVLLIGAQAHLFETLSHSLVSTDARQQRTEEQQADKWGQMHVKVVVNVTTCRSLLQHTHTHTRTHIHMSMHAHARARTQKCSNTRAVRTHTHTYTRTHMHAHTCTHTPALLAGRRVWQVREQKVHPR